MKIIQKKEMEDLEKGYPFMICLKTTYVLVMALRSSHVPTMTERQWLLLERILTSYLGSAAWIINICLGYNRGNGTQATDLLSLTSKVHQQQQQHFNHFTCVI